MVQGFLITKPFSISFLVVTFIYFLTENLGTNWASDLDYQHIGSVRKA